MGEFVNFITKGIEFEKDGDRRIFSGHISAEIIDHQNDFIFVKEILEVMDIFMKVLPVISEVHTNRMVGKVLGYKKSEIEGHASVKIRAEIFKQDGVTLYDQVWKKIKSGEYSGFSMGGGSKKREPTMEDGKYFMNLSDLELYEIAVCPSPANPLAIIDKFNELAKSDLAEKIQKIDGRGIIQCSSISCRFGKGTNKDIDIDTDNEQKLKPFDKPIEKDNTEYIERDVDNRRSDKITPKIPEQVEKHHIPGMTEEQEKEAREKNKKMVVKILKDRSDLIKDNQEKIKDLKEKFKHFN